MGYEQAMGFSTKPPAETCGRWFRQKNDWQKHGDKESGRK
jgi:hypothetical protein